MLELLDQRAAGSGGGRSLDVWRVRRRARLIGDLDLGGREEPADAVDELKSIAGGPKVDVEGVEAVVVLCLIVGVKGRQVPLALVDWGARDAVDSDGDETLLLVRVADSRVVEDCGGWHRRPEVSRCPPRNERKLLTALESVLVVGSGRVCYLDTSRPCVGILKEIDVGALVEAVMARAHCLGPVEVVDISKAGSMRSAHGQAKLWQEHIVQCCHALLARPDSHGGCFKSALGSRVVSVSAQAVVVMGGVLAQDV